MRYQIKILLFIGVTLFSCSNEDGNDNGDNTFEISGNEIHKNGRAVQLLGATALHTFATGSSDMVSWNLDIVREFIGNVSENPLTGFPIEDSNGQFLYALQEIVDDNRSNNLVTILCPFGWNGQQESLFTGKFPTQTEFWSDFKLKLTSWAEQFKDQPDVWIEVWNEPYRFDRLDGYTDEIWTSTMQELYNVIRDAGNDNIILIPCAEQGQDESVLLSEGQNFLTNNQNVLFDIHAYEKWLLETQENISHRIDSLIDANLPIFIGEVAPVNSGVLMDPEPFLNIIFSKDISFAAWLWKYDETDQDALLTSQGLPNNFNNNNWGSLYNEIARRER